MEFQKIDNTKIPDVGVYVNDYLQKYPETILYVGADSSESGNTITYSNPIILYRPGKGGHVVQRKIKLKKSEIFSIQQKLFKEVELVAEICSYLMDEIGISPKDIHAHLDYNGNKLHKSNIVHDEGVGWLKGIGLVNVYTKPYAWASSSAGDNLCRK